MPQTPDQSALLATCRQLLQPLARLALSKGLTYQTLDELLRSALVDEARQLHADAPAHGLVSRVSTTTGLNRREATRLLDDARQPAEPQRWLVGELFARWRTAPELQRDASPIELPRQGPAPSFESLAQSVTKDVHPRSLLDELCRLDLANWDADRDVVGLKREAFVPRADVGKMLALLADNVGDHLQAAVDNVLGQGSEHFEQAIFADELSTSSVDSLRPVITAQWAALIAALVPRLEALIAADAAAQRPQDQRIRLGFYSYSAATTRTESADATSTSSTSLPTSTPASKPAASPDDTTAGPTAPVRRRRTPSKPS